MNKFLIYLAIFSVTSLANLYSAPVQRGSGAQGIGPATAREHFQNEAIEEGAGGANGAYYGGYGGVYLAPEQDIDPSQTQFDNSYYEALEHPPEVP